MKAAKMQDWKITFNGANGSLTFYDLDMVLDFMAVQNLRLPKNGDVTIKELRDGLWWRVALIRDGQHVGQLERNN